MKLNYKRTILVGFAFFLISAFWQAYDAIVPLALTNHFGLPQSISGVIMSIDNILAVFMLPIFGAISDKIMTQLGRRTPFIIVGTLAAVISFVLLTLVNGIQLNALVESGIVERYQDALAAYNSTVATDASAAEKAFDLAKETLKADALQLTLNNIWPLVGFIGVLLAS